MRNPEEYVLSLYPHLKDQPKLLALVAGMQRFNPDLPEDVRIPTRILDWKDNLKHNEDLKDIRTAIYLKEKK